VNFSTLTGPLKCARCCANQSERAAASMVCVLWVSVLIAIARQLANGVRRSIVIGLCDLHQFLSVSNDQARLLDTNHFFPFHCFELLVDPLA
jgi:hypothetical protein